MSSNSDDNNNNNFRRGIGRKVVRPQDHKTVPKQTSFKGGLERLAAASTTGVAVANSVVNSQNGDWLQRGVDEISAKDGNYQGATRKGEGRVLNHWASAMLQKPWIQYTIGEFTHSQRSLEGRPSDKEDLDDKDDGEPILDASGNPIPPLHQALLKQSSRFRRERTEYESTANSSNNTTTIQLHERQIKRILQILESDIDAASRPMVDIENSEVVGRDIGMEFPLHKVIREGYPDDIVLGILNASTTEVVGTPDRTGTLPLHSAILNQRSEIVIYSLVNLYPAAATLPMPILNTSQLISLGADREVGDETRSKKKISVTFAETERTTTTTTHNHSQKNASATSVVQTQGIKLIEEAAEVGFLPFHCAHVLGFSVELVGIFFDLFKSEARQQRLCHEQKHKQHTSSLQQTKHESKNSNSEKVLPLHYVIHHRLPEKFILDVLLHDPKAAKLRYVHDDSGDLPLHRALRLGVSDCVVLNILIEFSYAAKIRNYQRGRLPLHEAASRHDTTPVILRALLKRYPQAINELDADGRCPRYYVEPRLCEESIDLLCGVKDYAYATQQEHIDEEEKVTSKAPSYNSNKTKGRIRSPRSTAHLNHTKEQTRSNAYDERNIGDFGSHSSSTKSLDFPSSTPFDFEQTGDNVDDNEYDTGNSDNVGLLSRIKKRSSSEYDIDDDDDKNKSTETNINKHRTGVEKESAHDRKDGVVDGVFEVEFKRTNIAHWYDSALCDDDDEDDDESEMYNYSVVRGDRDSDSHVIKGTTGHDIGRDLEANYIRRNLQNDRKALNSNIGSSRDQNSNEKSRQRHSCTSSKDHSSSSSSPSSSSSTTTSCSSNDHAEGGQENDRASFSYSKLNGANKNIEDNSATADDDSAWNAFNQDYG